VTDRWRPISKLLPADGVVVMTRIDDGRGVRNEQPLYRDGRLWFLKDGSMYVYYTPTHWMPMPSPAPSQPEARK
jgi:hypothetical protein